MDWFLCDNGLRPERVNELFLLLKSLEKHRPSDEFRGNRS